MRLSVAAAALPVLLLGVSSRAQAQTTTVTVEEVDERAILVEFYEATSGPSWHSDTLWNRDDEDICNWYGIVCETLEEEFGGVEEPTNTENDGGRRTQKLTAKVTGIDMYDNNLSGRVPDSFWKLPLLDTVYLSFNNNLDVSFVNLKDAKLLKSLRIHSTGTTSLHNINEVKDTLEDLHMSGVNLASTIPDNIWELTNLKQLHMAQMGLQGAIPDEMGLLVDLEEFNIYQNSITGTIPSALENMPNMRQLTLSRNNLEGDLPSFLNDMVNMEELYLENNDITGELLTFKAMPKLNRLYLNYNQITGSIPVHFIEALYQYSGTKDVRVNLAGNMLSGELGEDLDVLQAIPLELVVNDNQITSINNFLCDNNAWFPREAPSPFSCDAILCPKGTYNAVGHATADQPCQRCASAQYMGQTSCQDRDDEGILKLLYLSTGGKGWKNKDNWLSDEVDLCQWYGITCWDLGDDRDGRIRHIHLDDNNLKGTIPTNLYSLETLTVISLARNDVVLDFRSIAQSPHMHRIDVSATQTVIFDGISEAPDFFKHLVADKLQIAGTIPSEILQTKSLESISMAGCGLTGPLSSDFGLLENLKELYLYNNALRGSIPEAFANMQELQILSLAKNALTGALPNGMDSLPNLQALSLTDQVSKGGGISGEVSALSEARSLTTVMLGGNRIEGEIPKEFLRNVDLDASIAVDLSNNMLTGTVPGGLARFERMDIYLENNELTGVDNRLCARDEWMGGNVREFGCDAILCPEYTTTELGRRIYDNQECSDCTDPQASSYLGQTQCGGTTFISSEKEILNMIFEKCGGVNWHNSENWASDEAHHCDWYGIDCDEAKSVVAINLGSNGVVGTIPTEIFQLPNLQRLSLYSNSIGFDANGIDQARNLQSLVLDNTKLNSLEKFGLARSVTSLNIRSNNLKGSIPEEISHLVNLRTLNIAENKFDGTIPQWFNQLPNLETLLLAQNKIKGPLPTFFSMQQIKYVDLSHNRFTGRIPDGFMANVESDEKIFSDLSHNSLTGTVPQSLSHIPNLVIQLQGNLFEAVDESLCELDGWNNGDVSNFGCDGILCPAGSSNSDGRHTEDLPCEACKRAKHMGTVNCSGASAVIAAAMRTTLIGLGGMMTMYLVF